MQTYFTGIWKHIVGPSNPEPIKNQKNPENPKIANEEEIFQTVCSETLIPQVTEYENLRESSKNQDFEKNNSQENFQDFECENLINENEEEEKKTENENLPENEKTIAEKQENTEISIEENLKVSFQDGFLDRNTISQIFEKGVEIAKNEYVSLVLQNRKERRKIFSTNKKEYSNLIIDFLEDTENVISAAYENVCKSLKLSENLFEKSCLKLMEDGFFQEIFTLQAKSRLQLKKYLPGGENKSTFDFKSVLKYQLEVLKTQENELEFLIEGLKADMDTVQMIPLGISLILSDFVYEKFHVEEEDQINLAQNFEILRNDIELHQLLMNLELAIQSLLEKKGIMAGMTKEKMAGYE